MFQNRRDAGKKLARALEKYRTEQPLVLAIPKGGVEVGDQVAQHLAAPLSAVVARKLGHPLQPELAVGALAEDGSLYLISELTAHLLPQVLERLIAVQREEIRRRIEFFRNGRPLPEIKGRVVLLVDDGIAMGATMRAAIQLCRKREAGKIIVAVPVSSPEILQTLSQTVDEMVVLETPLYFRAVGQVYEDFQDFPEEEVRRILARYV